MYSITCDSCKISASGETLGAAIDNFNKHHLNHIDLGLGNGNVTVTPNWRPLYPQYPQIDWGYWVVTSQTQTTTDTVPFVTGMTVMS